MGDVTAARDNQTSAASALHAVKLLHTLVWAIFALAILSIPVFAWIAEYSYAAVLISLVLAEVLVLLANGLRCPLTTIAARFTADRRDNFDIYLPAWLARHNQRIFGTLYALGTAFTTALWIQRHW
jgi:Flp pilus assembly pilin Flp